MAASGGVSGDFAVVAISAPASLRPGTNVVDTRLPVAAGDRLGIDGDPQAGVLYCTTPNSFDKGAVILPGAAPGATVQTDLTTAKISLPLMATIEPDADGDGYGDETQDHCPQSAATQVACPPPSPPPSPPAIRLSAFSIAGREAVTVLVAGDTAAPVTVSGTVKLGGKGLPLTLAGGTKSLAAATITSFRLALPVRLQEKLAALPRSRALALKVTVTAPNGAGQISSEQLKVRLKGRE